MRRLSRMLILAFAALFVASCSTELPVPIVGYYRVSEFKEDTFAYFYLALRDDGTFTLYQAGGATNSEGYVFSGKWSSRLNAFNFLKGDGTLVFYDVEGPSDASGLVLTPGIDNPYSFYWSKSVDSAEATLALESRNRYICKDIATGFNIPKDEFDRIVYGDSGTEETL